MKNKHMSINPRNINTLYTRWSKNCALFSLLLVMHTGLVIAGNDTQPEHDVVLDMSDPSSWTIDTVHLGTRQLDISYDASEEAAVILPTWSSDDINAIVAGERNTDHSKLHIYQMIEASDCSQADAYFEILLPREYVEEGLLEFVFSLQAGARGDYLFNGRTFTMADFGDAGGRYKKMIVNVSEFNEPPEKQRAIERVNFIFHRNGSMVSAPIKIRRFALDLNSEKILPPQKDVKVTNPKSFYRFVYDNQESIDGFQARISTEDMDITRQLNESRTGMTLIPHWKEDQVPVGHSGKVTMIQPLGGIHNFDIFEVQYTINIPKAYFTEGRMDVYLFVQAGAAGFDRWSGTGRELSSLADKAGHDMVLSMTEQDFLHHGKKRNQIEVVGLQLNRNGSTVTEPITLKSITIKLPEESN